tara:strand:- start:10477 stop:11661 length:1185 start_codon:yes stop_codon:yes gene_type:complete
MNNKKISSLLNKGIKFESLKMLNETQINTLYTAVIGEQETLTGKVADVQKLKQVNIELQNDIKNTIALVGEEESEEELNEWGSSDQHFFNQSIHKQLGEPEKMPSPFSSKFEDAVEDAVDFYWDDWEEYKTNRDGLIQNGKRAYLRSYFRDEFAMLVKMFEPADELHDDDGEISEDKASTDSLEKMSGYDPYAGNSVGNDGGPSSDDGFNDKADDGMDEEVGEEFKSKSQQKYFFAKCEEEGPKSKWCKMADEFADDTKDFSKLPEKVKKEEIRQIEESLVSLVKKHIPKTMSKKDLLDLTEQSPGVKEVPVKAPTRTKPDRKSPYKPKHKPAPKAGDTKTAPPKVKPGTIQKPDRKSPYKPKHKPAPKAGKEGLPEFLKFNKLNIKFRDEQKN